MAKELPPEMWHQRLADRSPELPVSNRIRRACPELATDHPKLASVETA